MDEWQTELADERWTAFESTRAGTGEILLSKIRKGSAGSSRGLGRFVDELAAIVRRSDARGKLTVC